MFEGTSEGHQGTPGQSQAGSGALARHTTLRTAVHNQLADGEQGTPFNPYSPYRACVIVMLVLRSWVVRGRHGAYERFKYRFVSYGLGDGGACVR